MLLSYDDGTYDGTATSTIEWQVVGPDADFKHGVAEDHTEANDLAARMPEKLTQMQNRKA